MLSIQRLNRPDRPFNAHARQRVFKFRSAVTTYPVSSSINREYPAEVAVVATEDKIENVYQLLHKRSSRHKLLSLSVHTTFPWRRPGMHHAMQCFFPATEGWLRPNAFGGDAELIEVVAEFPQELMVAVRHSSIADLVAAVKSDFGSGLHHHAGIEVAGVLFARVPLSGDSEALVHRLLEGKLASRALCRRHHVLREIVTAEAEPRSTVEDLGELSVKIITSVVVRFAGGEI